MRIKKLLILIPLLIGIALFLVCMPPIILNNVKRNAYREWREHKIENYAGVITVWHIAKVKAHTGSVSGWLEHRASSVENRHTNIYVSILALTEEEYEERVMRGEAADIYSFPLGMFYPDNLLCMSESKNELRDCFSSVGVANGESYALPYAYSGYALLENTTLSQKQGSYTNLADDFSGDALTSLANSATTTDRNGKVKVHGLSGNCIVSALVGVECEVAAIEEYTLGNAAYAISDFRTVGDCERRLENGKGFSLESYCITDYTDQVQMIGINKSINAEKLEYAWEFVNELYDDTAQKTLAKLNLYSVTDIGATADMYTSIAQVCFEKYATPTIPNAFLFKRHENALQGAAIAALSGDTAAKSSFFERFGEVLQN